MIDKHLWQSLRAAQDRNFTYFQVSAALNAQNDIDHKATLFAILGDEEPAVKLNDLNAEKCTENDMAMTEYTNKIEESKDKNLNTLQWEALLDDEENKAILLVTNRIKQATAKAKEVIAALPPAAQDAAAGVWIKGANIAMEVFQYLADQLEKVASKIVDFLKKVFTFVTEAFQKVKNAVKSGIAAIFGRFAIANDIPIGPEVYTVKSGSYKGRLTWPSTTAEYIAVLEYGSIAINIKTQGWTIFGSSFKGSRGDGPNATTSWLDFGSHHRKADYDTLRTV